MAISLRKSGDSETALDNREITPEHVISEEAAVAQYLSAKNPIPSVVMQSVSSASVVQLPAAQTPTPCISDSQKPTPIKSVAKKDTALLKKIAECKSKYHAHCRTFIILWIVTLLIAGLATLLLIKAVVPEYARQGLSERNEALCNAATKLGTASSDSRSSLKWTTVPCKITQVPGFSNRVLVKCADLPEIYLNILDNTCLQESYISVCQFSCGDTPVTIVNLPSATGIDNDTLERAINSYVKASKPLYDSIDANTAAICVHGFRLTGDYTLSLTGAVLLFVVCFGFSIPLATTGMSMSSSKKELKNLLDKVN